MGRERGKAQRKGKSLLVPAVPCSCVGFSLSIDAIFLSEAYRRTTGQILCLEQMSPAGLFTTVGKVSSTGTTRITSYLSSTAFSNGLKGLWFWKLYMYIFSLTLLAVFLSSSNSKQTQMLEWSKRPAKKINICKEVSGVCFQMMCVNQGDTQEVGGESSCH